MKDYIYIKIKFNNYLGCYRSKIIIKDRCNKTVFKGITDNYGNIEIPVCDNEIYQVYILSNIKTLIIPLLAIKNKTYQIDINNKIDNHPITLLLIDTNYPNIKIEGGKIVLWQGIQFQ